MKEPQSILIVDDSRFNRELLRGLIHSLGYVSHTADNGQSALAAIRSTPPDLVLLDLVDHIAGQGIGDGSQFYLFGFSAGGQFTQRFGLAHPDRLVASVVASPSSHAFPDKYCPVEPEAGL